MHIIAARERRLRKRSEWCHWARRRLKWHEQTDPGTTKRRYMSYSSVEQLLKQEWNKNGWMRPQRTIRRLMKVWKNHPGLIENSKRPWCNDLNNFSFCKPKAEWKDFNLTKTIKKALKKTGWGSSKMSQSHELRSTTKQLKDQSCASFIWKVWIYD